MTDLTPLPVIPYANGGDRNRVPLLRQALRYGIVALTLTAFYIPAWTGGRCFFCHDTVCAFGPFEGLVDHFVPVIQAVFLGAGLALTFVARDAGGLHQSRLKYLAAFTVNLLAFTSLVINLTGVLANSRELRQHYSPPTGI